MANMDVRRRGFVIVHHREQLYTVGGLMRQPNPDPQTNTYSYDNASIMEQYSFRENTWVSTQVPYAFFSHAACVLGDTIYLGGRRIHLATGEESIQSLCSLDLSSPGQAWERKEDFTYRFAFDPHEMFVVDIKGENVVLAVMDDMRMYYYSPANDEWTYFIYTVERKYEETYFILHGMILAQDNTVFLLNVELNGFESEGSGSEYEEERRMRDRICMKWEVPKRGNHITNVPVQNFPLSPRPSGEPQVKIFGAILAIPL